MTTCDEIKEILRNREREKLTVELKTRGTLINRQTDIASGLVSLANRFGGSMIFGFRNNGAPDGSKFDVDADKGLIDMICTTKCSPPIEYDTEFLECTDFETLLVHVNKRKGIPHAVVEKSGGEILNRSYYVRTSHGKRLVTDTQLDWMFSHYPDMSMDEHFAVKIPYFTESLRIPHYRTMPNSPLAKDWFTQMYIQDLKEEILEPRETDNINLLRDIYLRILPLSLLERISQYYRYHWITRVEFRETVSTDVIKLSDVEIELEYPLESMKDYVERHLSYGMPQISVPQGTKIQVGQSDEYITYLRIFVADFFEFYFDLGYVSWSIGLPRDGPASYVMYQELAIRSDQDEFSHFHFNGHIMTKLDVFNLEYTNYDIYDSWIESLTNLTKNHFSWEEYLHNIPHGIHYRIDENIKKLLRAFTGKKQ